MIQFIHIWNQIKSLWRIGQIPFELTFKPLLLFFWQFFLKFTHHLLHHINFLLIIRNLFVNLPVFFEKLLIRVLLIILVYSQRLVLLILHVLFLFLLFVHFIEKMNDSLMLFGNGFSGKSRPLLRVDPLLIFFKFLIHFVNYFLKHSAFIIQLSSQCLFLLCSWFEFIVECNYFIEVAYIRFLQILNRFHPLLYYLIWIFLFWNVLSIDLLFWSLI